MRLDYAGIVSEPDFSENNIDAARVFQPVSQCLNAFFDTVHITIYFVLSLVFGSVLAIIWGLVFGIVNFLTVWFVQPFIKLWFTAFRCGFMIWRVWTRMWCDPCYESVALAFSKIRGNVTVNVKRLHDV